MIDRDGIAEDLFWAKVDKTGSCWLWTAYRDRAGYGTFSIKRHPHRAHRVSAVLAGMEVPDHLFVCHHCDTPSCVNPAHLFVGTPSDNLRDAYNKKRRVGMAGVDHPGAKLTAEDVRWIRQLGAPQRQIAKCFGVSQSVISHIKTGYTWSHTK
jgi:hypothetical protein